MAVSLCHIPAKTNSSSELSASSRLVLSIFISSAKLSASSVRVLHFRLGQIFKKMNSKLGREFLYSFFENFQSYRFF